jgi:arylsulfatase A-like enzyme
MSADQVRKVLFISADQWRGECLSALDHTCVRTPNLDALAAEGVLFRNHYCQASPCGPARTSMLTGMYMMNHRSLRNGTPLDSRFTNLALEARKAGYDPTLFGYTDTSPDPRRYPSDDPILKTYEGVLPGMTVGLQLPEHMAAWIADLRAKGYDIPRGRHDVYRPVANYPGADGRGHSFAPPAFSADDSETTFMADAILRYLSVRQDENWFVHGVFLRPHPPIIAPEPYNAMYDPASVPLPRRAATPNAEAAQHPYLAYALKALAEIGKYNEHYPHSLLEIDDTELRQLRATYYGMITQVDDQIGRLIAHLKKTGEYDHTLIIFTCDHGEMLGDHWLWGKPGYFDEAFHIPLIIRDPRVAAEDGRGRVVAEFTEAVDLMPTVLDWLGLEPPAQCNGRSLLPFIVGRSPAGWRREVHWEYDFSDIVDLDPESALGLDSDQCSLNVIRDQRYKYVHFTALPPLFFDLEKDPGQFNNLADDPALLPLVLAYGRKLLSWRMEHNERSMTRTFITENGVFERPRTRR